MNLDFVGSNLGPTTCKLYRLDKLLNLVVPQFSHLSNRVDDNILCLPQKVVPRAMS